MKAKLNRKSCNGVIIRLRIGPITTDSRQITNNQRENQLNHRRQFSANIKKNCLTVQLTKRSLRLILAPLLMIADMLVKVSNRTETVHKRNIISMTTSHTGKLFVIPLHRLVVAFSRVIWTMFFHLKFLGKISYSGLVLNFEYLHENSIALWRIPHLSWRINMIYFMI